MNKAMPYFAFFIFSVSRAAGVEAGGMIEEVDTYATDLAEDTTVKVSGRDLLLQKGTNALFYKQDAAFQVGDKTVVFTSYLTSIFALIIYFHQNGGVELTNREISFASTGRKITRRQNLQPMLSLIWTY